MYNEGMASDSRWAGTLREKMMKYEAVCMNGEVIDNNGRGYASRAGAAKAANRKGVCVETRPLGQKQPHKNDAQGWDRYRLQDGLASR